MAKKGSSGLDRFWRRNAIPELTTELNRRKKIYAEAALGQPPLDDESRRWLYQKTAYLTLRRLPDIESATTNYDIQFGPTKMDIVYDNKPGSYRYRGVKPLFGRESTAITTIDNKRIDPGIMLTPLVQPLLNLYDPDKGFISTVLVSANIETFGEGMAFTQKFSIQFTVYDSDVLASYLTNFMRPLTPVELSYGWSTEDSPACNGSLRGTVTNFHFSANQDGSWKCSIEGFSNPQIAHGIELNSTFTAVTTLTTVTGKRNEIIPYLKDNTYVAPPIPPQGAGDPAAAGLFIINEGGLGSVLTNLTENASILFDDLPFAPGYGASVPNQVKECPPDYTNLGQVTGFYIVDIPGTGKYVPGWYAVRAVEDFIGMDPATTIPLAYLRLDSLIHIINCILAYNVKGQQDLPYRVVIDPAFSKFIGPHPNILKTGPADFFKFAWAEQSVGGYSFPLVPDFEQERVEEFSDERYYYIGSILINSAFALSEFIGLSNSIKTNQPANFYTYLNDILKQLSLETGGMINASCVVTDTEILIVDANYISNEYPKNKATTIPAITANSICREAKIESNISKEILTAASMAANSYTSIGRPTKSAIGLGTINGEPLTWRVWYFLSDGDRASYSAAIGIPIGEIEQELNRNYLKDPNTIVELILRLNYAYGGIGTGSNIEEDSALDIFLDLLNGSAPPPSQNQTNALKNKNKVYLDWIIKEPYPTSHTAYVLRIQELYRSIFQGAYQTALEGDSSKYKSFFYLRSARFPISLSVKLDGIEGFYYGNPITTNWLPTGYSNKNCFFTVMKISHTIENNDWTTTLDTLYEIIQDGK